MLCRFIQGRLIACSNCETSVGYSGVTHCSLFGWAALGEQRYLMRPMPGIYWLTARSAATHLYGQPCRSPGTGADCRCQTPMTGQPQSQQGLLARTCCEKQWDGAGEGATREVGQYFSGTNVFVLGPGNKHNIAQPQDWGQEADMDQRPAQ